jgi:integrase
LSRRLVESVGQQEVRQHGYVYQKNRKQSDKWIPTERAYGRYRVDVPGEPGQREVRVALGFCRDRISAMLKLQNAMSDAGVLDAAKLRERISSMAAFAQQAQWMIAEMKAGRIVNGKTRERIGNRTIDFYSTAITYLSEQVGTKPLANIENAEARELVSRMRSERNKDGTGRFSVKTLTEYFKVFTKVLKSAVDDNGNQTHPRTWNLTFIGLPKVDKKKQHRPTLTPKEMSHLVANLTGRYQMGAALLAGSSLRISELLALRIEEHISGDRKTLYIRQQRKKDGSGVTDVLKTAAAYRDVDLHSSLAKMLDDCIGDRMSGFLIQTESGKMLSPENFFRDGFETVLKKMGRTGVRFHAFRRFREAVLQKSEARQLLIDYWMGHENDDMSTRYGKQLLEDVEYRNEWAEKVGLGFDLPKAKSGLFGLHGLQNKEQSVAA